MFNGKPLLVESATSLAGGQLYEVKYSLKNEIIKPVSIEIKQHTRKFK